MWTTEMHTLTWKAASYAYVNSKCPVWGAAGKAEGKLKEPAAGQTTCTYWRHWDSNGEQTYDNGKRLYGSIFAWTCTGNAELGPFVLVAIRGTDIRFPNQPEDSKKDKCFLNDLNADHDLFDKGHIRSAGRDSNMDSGMGKKYLQTVIDFLVAHDGARGGKPYVLTGHSLGGGLAILAANHLMQNKYLMVDGRPLVDAHNVWAYGAPPVRPPLREKMMFMNLMYNKQDPVYTAVLRRRSEQLRVDGVCTFELAPSDEADSVEEEGNSNFALGQMQLESRVNCPACLDGVDRGTSAGERGAIWPDTKECTACVKAAHMIAAYGPGKNGGWPATECIWSSQVQSVGDGVRQAMANAAAEAKRNVKAAVRLWELRANATQQK